MTSRTPTALASKAPSVSNKRKGTRFALAFATALTPVWVLADTLPTGGTVVGGAATIARPDANTLTINQGSDRAIVNWDGFSVGAGNSVNITQPSVDSAILNRVTGDTTSEIHGSINANGRVFVVNPNGIFIGRTGNVSAGGFVASTLDIRDDDFITGQTVFEGNGSSATVENAGNVQVVTGGYAALIGGKVKNSGTIQAPLGFVGLGSGERITLDLAGNGFLQVAIPTDSGDDGLEALIENSGTIQANGGTVQISAATARNAARHAINMSGVVEARTVSGRNGRVTLGGGGGGKVTVSGKVRTTARRPAIQVVQSARPALRPERGGDITITGRDIDIQGANIDASGIDGGGNIRIGGNRAGGPGLPTATTLTVDEGTTILADAITRGDGGRVILWSDVHTEYSGQISAKGGSESGNGGFAEVSGKLDLSYDGAVDLRAENGSWGELLLDPTDIEIVTAVSGPNQLAAATIESDLDTVGFFTVDTNSTFGSGGFDDGDITVNAPLTWSSTGILRLVADNTITINQPITGTSGELRLTAFGTLPITTGPGGAIDVGSFEIFRGDWQQVGATLPAFNADNFFLNNNTNTSFLRALGGDGLGAPYELTDVFGLQGAATVNGGIANFVLANNIDASGTLGWLSNDPAVNGVRDAGLEPRAFNGVFDGQGFDISGLYIQRHTETFGAPEAGLFSSLGGTVRDLTITGATVDGPQTGIVTALNTGTIDGVFVSGVVRVNGVPGSPSFGGGIAAINDDGMITDSGSSVALLDRVDPSSLALLGAEDLFIGGIVGQNIGTGVIDQAKSIGSASFSLPLVGRVGGIAGSNSGTVSNSYVTGSVSADTNNGTSGHAGSIVGQNTGTITNVLANGPVSLVGPNLSGGVGAVVGTDDPSPNNITNSYFNTDTTGQALSGQSGEIDAGTLGPFDGARAETTATLADAQGFFDNADAAGWDFLNIWSLPQDGTDHTRLYAHDLVISAFAEDPDATFSYDSTSTGFTVNGTIAGGLGLYRFEPNGTGDALDLNDNVTLSSANAGPVTYTFASTFTTDQGLPFNVRQLTNNGTVNPAPLTVTVGDTTKTYGTTLAFADVTLNAVTLFGSDSITSGTVVSMGADATATVAGNPYALSVGGLSGTGLTNYDISIVPGELTVAPAALAISINDAVKTYGDTLVFNNTEFVVSGLVNADTVTALTLSSAGAPADAQVAGSPFPIVGGGLNGTGLANYTVTIAPGDLTVAPSALNVTIDDATKTYGETLTFDGTEFTVSGLLNTDTFSSLTLSSEGAEADAQVADGPFPIVGTNANGTGLSNYIVTITPGDLTVTPSALSLTIDNVTKTYGDTLIFDGSEFSVTGLLNDDSITSLTISSEGAAPEAIVADSPFATIGTDPVGNGISNYTLSIIPGQLTVTPAPLTITADGQSKGFGTEFTFTGNEFTAEGLANDDTVASATLSSAAAAGNAGITGDLGTAILITDPQGTGLENYEITLVGGVFVVAPGALTITADNQTKVYGTTFTFNGTEFTVSGLAEGDSVDSVTLVSDATDANAQVSDSPFAITASDAVGSGLENYSITFTEGSLFDVTQAPLTIEALDQNKQQGQLFTFDGTEFTTTGLLNDDSVTSAVLSSDGAAAEALAADSPFDINIGDLSGTGLGNYDISRVTGTFTIDNQITPPIINPVAVASSSISNPPDIINLSFGTDGDTGVVDLAGLQSEGTSTSTRAISLPEANETLEVVDAISDGLEAQAASCGSADQDFTNYMACLSQSLDTYSNALDQIVNDLPSGLETVSATIRTASDEVRAAAARAQRRLATATSDTQRRAIRRQAVAEAQGAINTAKAEIRKAITLIRADDPEVAAVQRDTGARIVQAFDTVESSLVRAVEL